MAYTKKLEDSKKDMNFFSEFGGAAGQVGSYLSLILILFVGFILIAGSIYGLFFLQAFGVRSQINDLTAKMSSEEYQEELNKHQIVSHQLAGLTEEYYDISMLYANIDNQSQVNSAYMDVVTKNLPRDMTLTDIIYDGSQMTLSGTTSAYYSPMDFLANLSKEEVFSSCEIESINQIAADDEVDDLGYLYLYKYNYSVTCYIRETFSVRVYRVQDDVTNKTLAPIDISKVNIGEKFSLSSIAEYKALTGEIYTLARVIVNDVEITPEQFQEVIASDSFAGLVKAETNIKLYYLPKTGVVAK